MAYPIILFKVVKKFQEKERQLALGIYIYR